MSKASESDMSEGEDSEEFSFDEESEEFSFDEEEEKEEPLEEESSDSGEVYENRTLSTPKPSESPSVSAKPEEKLSKPIETEEKGLEKRGGDESSANPLTLEQVPLQIAVEIGRCQMALAKVMQLQPGNLLDLHVHPAEGVDLVVHGQCIGRGELVKLGELLGVRITEIG